MKKVLVLVVLITACSFGKKAYSQDPQNSIYSVPEQEKLYKVTIWRRVYMEEKQNQAFFARNREISRILIDAVRDGLLIPYNSDSLTRRLSKEQFEERLTIKTGADEDNWGGAADDGWGDADEEDGGGGDDPWGDGGDDVWGGAEETQPTSFKRDPTEINIMEIKEEIFFDKIRSRMYNAVQAITIFYTDINTGIREPVASFDFQEAEKVFRQNPDQAIWYNRQNTGQNLNLADAFLLRLFHGMIYKISNPNDETLLGEVSDPQLAIYLSQQREHKLAEYESDLWEY